MISSLWKKLTLPQEEESLLQALQHLPEQNLLKRLAAKRARGRNDYPIDLLWKSLLSSLLLQLPSIEELRKTSAQKNPLPPPSAYSRFLSGLIEEQEELEQMQIVLMERIAALSPEWGSTLTMLESCIELPTLSTTKGSNTRRSHLEADWGEKIVLPSSPSLPQQKVRWFGYRVHALLDTRTSLPLLYSITPASASPAQEILQLFATLQEKSPSLLQRCRYALGDSTYDNKQLITSLWDLYTIKPIIELSLDNKKESWKKLSYCPTALYSNKGKIACLSPVNGEQKEMVFAGFEEQRKTLKYRCISSCYNLLCPGKQVCPIKGGVRVPLATDRRLFTPVARSSYKWKNLSSQLANSSYYRAFLTDRLHPKKHFTRGLDKWRIRLALINALLLSQAYSYLKK